MSATLLSAPLVLALSAHVLAQHACAFKFARRLDDLAELLSNQCERGSGGKFITAYPIDDEHLRQIAEELDQATDGLPGPVILSDRPWRAGSLVHYRYGVFAAEPILTNDGLFEAMLTGPDGSRQPDRRLPWYSPPSWAIPPTPPTPPTSGESSRSPRDDGERTSVLIAGRFVVREAIRHSYRGGVFLATDRHSGTDVVVKQARPHVMGGLDGTDARDGLRHEARMLERLGPVGLAPRLTALVEQQDNLFLAEELVPGETLREWVEQRATGEWRGRGAPLAETVRLAEQLVALLSGVHDMDLVLRDLNPNNVMVTPDRQLQLVDLEGAAECGSRMSRVFTHGYASPEQLVAPVFGPVPPPTSDLFALGATIAYLASGLDVVLPLDDSSGRPLGVRFAELILAAGARIGTLRHLAPLVLGLTRDDPAERWSLARARDFLASVTTRVPDATTPAGPGGRASTMDLDTLLSDGLRYLLDTMRPTASTLWRMSEIGRSTDPCSVQYGAAGTLGVLAQAAGVIDEADLRSGVATAARWIDDRLFEVPRHLPGLYFGRSGTAWALHDAARVLDDDKLAARAVELLTRTPLVWPNPDICHGAAGAGLAHLHLWAATADPVLGQRTNECADGLLAAAQERAGGLVWPIPETFDSGIAGLVQYGFAHGVAGVATFLLAVWAHTGRADCLQAAQRAGETLSRAADIEDAAAWWPTGERIDPPTRRRHWCSGSSGVGTFLIRLWSATNVRRYRELAEAAAVAVRRDAWYSTTATCHGLPGDGEFLLDLADATGEERYRDWAEELAAVLYSRRTVLRGLRLVPDGSGTDVTAGYNTGLAGVLGFLLRLRHGGPRCWMVGAAQSPERR